MNWLKIAFLVLACLAVLVTMRTLLLPLTKSGASVLKVETPGSSAQVFLNEESLGETPITNNKLAAGDYELRVETTKDGEQLVFSRPVTLYSGKLTSVNLDFGPSEIYFSGDIRNSQSGNGLLVTTVPDSDKIFLNDEGVGAGTVSLSPHSGIHKITVSRSGYYTREIELEIGSNRRTVVEVFLALNPLGSPRKFQDGQTTIWGLYTDKQELISNSASRAAAVFFFEKIGGLAFDSLIDADGGQFYKDEAAWDKKINRGEKVVIGYLANKNDGDLTSKAKKTVANISKKPAQKVQIALTPTGFLNVRSGPGTGNSIIGRVAPGQTYELLEEKTGWYKIKVSDSTGWISSQYARKNGN